MKLLDQDIFVSSFLLGHQVIFKLFHDFVFGRLVAEGILRGAEVQGGAVVWIYSRVFALCYLTHVLKSHHFRS